MSVFGKRRASRLAATALLLLPAWGQARDLTEILREKGVLTKEEAAEIEESNAATSATASTSGAPPLPEWVSKLTPFGDVRLRNESFFRKDDPDRVRQRFRLRFGAKVKINDETELGFRLATGATGELISNNQTFDDTFQFKDFNITNAFIKVAPAKSFGWARPYVHVWGGKFDIPLYNPPTPTGLVFDRDLAPEGGFESLRLAESADGVLRGLFLNFGQWVFEESSRTGDSAIFAFQGATSLALAEGVLWNLGVGDYHLQKPSTIAVAKGRNATIVVTNAVRLSDGSILSGRAIDATRLGEDAEGNPLTIEGYVSDFNLVNAGTDLAISTGLPSWPLKLFFDYVVNTEAVGSEDTGYEGGFQIGLDKDPGDLAFTYAWEHLETDAVISAFSESDFGPDGGTNSEGHILRLNYVLLKNLALTSTAYITEPIDEVEGRNPETSYRWQVDVTAKF
jgi:hypothetical protein